MTHPVIGHYESDDDGLLRERESILDRCWLVMVDGWREQQGQMRPAFISNKSACRKCLSHICQTQPACPIDPRAVCVASKKWGKHTEGSTRWKPRASVSALQRSNVQRTRLIGQDIRRNLGLHRDCIHLSGASSCRRGPATPQTRRVAFVFFPAYHDKHLNRNLVIETLKTSFCM